MEQEILLGIELQIAKVQEAIIEQNKLIKQQNELQAIYLHDLKETLNQQNEITAKINLLLSRPTKEVIE